MIETQADGSVLVEGDAGHLLSLCQSILFSCQAVREHGTPHEHTYMAIDDAGARPITTRCVAVAEEVER